MNKNTICVFLIFLLLVFFSITLAAQRSDSTLNAAQLGVQSEKVDKNAYSKIYYVSIYGMDKLGNGTQEKPWQTIDHALAQISMDSSGNEVSALFVSEGVYNRSTLFMKSHLDLYGGFNAADWQRDVYKYQTTLDGQGERRVVVGADSARLDGFIIQNGQSQDHGAGILCDDTSPLITNNFIINNLVLEPDRFNHNRIHQEGINGGGIACLYNAVPVIRNNIFYKNQTSVGTGAAISFYGWVRHKDAPEMSVKENRLSGGLQARVENNVIINNTSGISDIKRTRSSSGAGISCAYEARPIIQNNLIALNQAKGRSDAGGIYCEYFSSPFIDGNWILGNIADDDGGGFYTMKLGQPLLTNNFFAGNYTTGRGVGAIRLSKEGRACISDNIIVFNPGGGVMSVDSYIELENNIIMNNPAGSGLKYVMNYSYFMPPVIENNIIKGNEDGEVIVLENAGLMLAYPDSLSQQEKIPEENGIAGNVHLLVFDPINYITKITLDKNIINYNNLVNRVIRIGNQWSIIKKSSSNIITVWGEIAEKPGSEFEVIGDYLQ